MLFPADIANKYKSYFKELGLVITDEILENRKYYETTKVFDLSYFSFNQDFGDEIDEYSLEWYDEYENTITLISHLYAHSYLLSQSFFLSDGNQVYVFFRDEKSLNRFTKYAHRVLTTPISVLTDEHREFLTNWFKYEIRKKGL